MLFCSNTRAAYFRAACYSHVNEVGVWSYHRGRMPQPDAMRVSLSNEDTRDLLDVSGYNSRHARLLVKQSRTGSSCLDGSKQVIIECVCIVDAVLGILYSRIFRACRYYRRVVLSD